MYRQAARTPSTPRPSRAAGLRSTARRCLCSADDSLWPEVHGIPAEEVAWGFCTVLVGEWVYALGHHSEKKFYGYGLPMVMAYNTRTGVWCLPKVTGVPMMWWNIGWLDCPELLASHSTHLIFSPFSFQIDTDSVAFDTLEVATHTWRPLRCTLGPINPTGCVYRFIHLGNASVLALVYVADPTDDAAPDGSVDTGYLSVRLLDLLAGTCEELAYSGTPPHAWPADAAPAACFTDPFLYLLDQPGSSCSCSDHCALYMFHLPRRRWTRIDPFPLPIPPDFPPDHLQPEMPVEGEGGEDRPTFARHFISHAGRLTCDVTYNGQSRMFGLQPGAPEAVEWRPLCDCDVLFGPLDCYCVTGEGVFHLNPHAGSATLCSVPGFGLAGPLSTPQRSPIMELSSDLLAVAFSFLGPDILATPHVCRSWRAVALLDREALEATWDAVLLPDVTHWLLVPRRFALLKLMLGTLEEYLQVAIPPADLLEEVYARRFRLGWQRPPSSRGQGPYQWCLSALMECEAAVRSDDDLTAPTSASVVIIDRHGDEVLSEDQATKLRYIPAPSSHFLMEMLRRLTDAKMAPNMVKPIFVLPDAVVYAAYYCASESPLMEIEEAKQRALEKVLREAPTLAVVQTQQLMELAYVTASQPGRRAEDHILDIRGYCKQSAAAQAELDLWRQVSLGEAVEGVDGPVVCFMLSTRRSLLLPYTIPDHMELFVK